MAWKWGSWLVAWDCSGGKFASLRQWPPSQVSFLWLEDPDIYMLYIVQYCINTVYFSPQLVQNKPHKEVTKVHLFLCLCGMAANSNTGITITSEAGHASVIVCRPCNFIPIHSLTGPVGWPFASRLGGQWFTSRGCKNSQWTRYLLLALSRYIGDLDVIQLQALPLFSGCFARLSANNVKSQLDRTSQTNPGSIPLPLLLTTQCPVKAPVKMLGGALWRPCNFTPIHSLTGPVGQPFASCLGGQRFLSHGCTNSQWNQVSPVSIVSLQ